MVVKKTLKYYKIVNLGDDGELYSMSVSGYARVKYIPGEISKATIGKLFIFNSLQQARDFIGPGLDNYQIWECNATGVEWIRWMMAWDSSFGAFKEFWKDRRRFRGDIPVPKGTLIASSIKLLRRMR